MVITMNPSKSCAFKDNYIELQCNSDNLFSYENCLQVIKR